MPCGARGDGVVDVLGELDVRLQADLVAVRGLGGQVAQLAQLASRASTLLLLELRGARRAARRRG